MAIIFFNRITELLVTFSVIWFLPFFSVRRPHTHYWCIFAENISFNKEDIYTKNCRPFLVHQGEDQILEDRSFVAICYQRMTKFPLLFHTMEWYALWVQNWPSYNAKGKWFINGRGRVRLHGGGKSYITYVPFPQYIIPVICTTLIPKRVTSC